MKTDLLCWSEDDKTKEMAVCHHLLDSSFTAPENQFVGYHFNPNKWRLWMIPSAACLPKTIASPDNIIRQFQDGCYSQAFAMTVQWGRMWRTRNAILRGTRSFDQIACVLKECACNIPKTQSIKEAWNKLTGQGHGEFGWSAVITSKTLHFLCRSLGFQKNPPVPIDNGVILERVWPAFVLRIQSSEPLENWSGNSFAAYSRYMTAILVWAKEKRWTTTQMEATIFEQYSQKINVS